MSRAFEQAWALLKAAFLPVPKERLGSGTSRITYGRPPLPDVTKLGLPVNIQDRILANALSEIANDYNNPVLNTFVPESAEQLPAHLSEIDPSLYHDKQGNPLDFIDMYGYHNIPVAYSQQVLRPIQEQTNETYHSHENLRQTLNDYLPALVPLGLDDVKRANWASGLNRGIVSKPHFGIDEPVSLIDPMFQHRLAQKETPWMSEAERQSAKPMLQDLVNTMQTPREYMEPWYSDIDQYNDPQSALSNLQMGREQAESDQEQLLRFLGSQGFL